MIVFASAIASVVAIFLSWPFITFGELVLLYIFLGAVVSFMFLRDSAKITRGGKNELFGTTYINKRFRVFNWKKFIVSWILLSFILIPALFFVMLEAEKN